MVGRPGGSKRSRRIAAFCVAAFTALVLVIDSPSVFAGTGAAAATAQPPHATVTRPHATAQPPHATAQPRHATATGDAPRSEPRTSRTTRARRVIPGSGTTHASLETTSGRALAYRGLSAADVSAIVTEAKWIISAQIPDGAIGVWPDTPTVRLVWPDLAGAAAAGLARATEVTGDPTYAEHAWAYLQWYASVEQPGTGYVTDYNIVGGTTPVSTGEFDSTDAYAGTFLAAAWDTYVATGDQSELAALAGGIAGALHAIASTQQPDGLTWATPSWQVAYLMDNSQAYGGLVAASRLEDALGNGGLARQAALRAAAMEAGIQSLWDPSTGAYDWARQANGWQHATQWSNIYPDALEQVAAVEWGAVTGARATTLMTTFAKDHPDWSVPTDEAQFLSGATVTTQPVGYWPMAGVAFNAVGRYGQALTGLSQILTAAGKVNYDWPFTTGNAGDAIIALSGGPLLDPATD